MRARWLVVAAALAAGAAGGGPGLAKAEVCVTATVYQAGQPTTSGPHCQPLLDEFPPFCPSPVAVVLGYGVNPTVCVPDVR